MKMLNDDIKLKNKNNFGNKIEILETNSLNCLNNKLDIKTKKVNFEIISNNINNENNINNNIFYKSKEILDKAINNITEISKEKMNKKLNEKERNLLIDNIKIITYEAVDKINKLTNFIVEQSYELMKKISQGEIIK